MARKHKPEDIIGKLREADIVRAQGGTVADACRRIYGQTMARNLSPMPSSNGWPRSA